MLNAGNISVQEGDMSTTLPNICNNNATKEQIDDFDELSEEAKKISGQRISKNSLRASESAINNFLIFWLKIRQNVQQKKFRKKILKR